ncbi:unnamed protein product (macronuclear) [Paramecium tetraurelia]|uniref:Uncharacterized protein n=1 Tax=Paramecium tetraurelia TaxID=5888 RepID=A0D042_PARTE|nr:uncharacterized protein GSPATT00011961001 [Paramecium tetraurelia]CAK76409.1 unnamed protein product [Paramecium tetraurelia]|eukprot:XP_001443806.1 hypothetical protein (macronuclear) [Paramecium tetraurelia strain d4-2]
MHKNFIIWRITDKILFRLILIEYHQMSISTKYFKNISEDCFNGVQQSIEISYQRISSFLDQIQLDVLHPPSSFQICKVSSKPLIQSQSNFSPNFLHPILTNQIIFEIKASLNFIISREVNNKEQTLRSETMLIQQKYDSLIEERQREQMEYLEQKDQVIQKFNNKNNLTQKQNREDQKGKKPLSFKLTNTYSYKQLQWCNAIALNKNSSLVVAASQNDIKGKLELLQICQNKNQVYTLNFMKNSNNFVSGFIDNSIIIWKENAENQWNFEQILNGHLGSILCLLLNNKDDLIISASQDKTIKFWIKQNQWKCSQTITDHTESVISISLNEQQNKLISSSLDYQILVIERSELDSNWNVRQKIKVDQKGLRLCFINDKLFTFQPSAQDQMHVYEIDRVTNQFRRTSEIAVKSGSNKCDSSFSQFYSKSKCLLLNKNGNFVNLMRMQKNGRFVVEQSIQFNDYHIFGQMTDDGELLVTWDAGSKEIQIRSFKEF